MTSDTRAAIRRMSEHEGLTPHKIALVLGVSDYSVRYVLFHNDERAKNRARVARWRAQRKAQ